MRSEAVLPADPGAAPRPGQPGIVRLTPDGPSGLAARPTLPPEILETPAPSIHGHTFYEDAGNRIKCLVWGATPYRIVPKTRPDYEFSILLDGEFTLIGPDGQGILVKAGDAFVLPTGFQYQWSQAVYVRKFAMSFTPAPGSDVGGPRGFTLIRPGDRRSGTLFTDRTGTWTVGIRESSELRGPIGPTDRLEMVRVLDGAVELREADGTRHRFGAGDTYLVAPGTACSVESSGRLRLLVCAFGRA